MEIGSGPSINAQIEVMKKATEVQEQTVSTLLNNSAAQLQEQQNTPPASEPVSGAELTGIGTGLDIRA